MTTRFKRLMILMVLLPAFLSACFLSQPSVIIATQAPPDAIYTAAALTLQAQLTQNAPPVIPATGELPTSQPELPSDTPLPFTPTNTPIIFTDTPMPTATFPFTPTSSLPLIAANIDTNCRGGPGPEYYRVGALLVGQVATVHGKNSSSTWWYIEDPKNPGHFCYVWGETTTVSGDLNSIPVLTPPPPPATLTPSGSSFNLAYSTIHKCSGDKHVIVSVKATGGTDFESASIKVKDETNGTNISGPVSKNSPFMPSKGDCPSDGKDTLEAGKTAYIAGSLAGATSGHDARVIVTLCTKDGLKGTCVSKYIIFEIP
jgi:hypothetical protein